MAVPKKLLILQKLTDHLKGITQANGYDVDLSTAVFRGRNTFGPSDPLPALSILEFPKPDTGLFAGMQNKAFIEDWMLLIQGWVKDDPTNPTDPAYYLGAAVQKRLSELTATKPNGNPVNDDTYLLGRLVNQILIGPFTVRPPDGQVSSTAYFFLPVRVGVAPDVSLP